MFFTPDQKVTTANLLDNTAVMLVKSEEEDLIVHKVNTEFINKFRLDPLKVTKQPVTTIFNNFQKKWCDVIKEVALNGNNRTFVAIINDEPVVIECFQPKQGFCSCLIKNDYQSTIFKGFQNLIENKYDIIFEYDINKRRLIFIKSGILYQDVIKSVKIDPEHFPQSGIIHINDLEKYRIMQDEILEKGYSNAVVKILDNEGMYHWHDFTMTMVNNSEDAIIYGFLINIDSLKKHELDLIRRAERDSLTNLYNRGTIEVLVNEVLINDFDQKHGLIVFDLDNFRDINNFNGHYIGDIILYEIGKRLLSNFSPNAFVARLGGDEFAIFIKNIPNQTYLAEKVKALNLLIQEAYENSEKKYFLTSSIGAAIFPKDGTDFTTLYQKADYALYVSKGKGRNNYCLYSDVKDLTYDYNPTDNFQKNLNELEIGHYLMHLINKEDFQSKMIKSMLKSLCEKFQFSRSYILETSKQNEGIEINYHYEMPHVEVRQSNLVSGANSLQSHLKYFNSEGIYIVSNINQVSPLYKNVFKSKGIKALLQIAFYHHDDLMAIVGFEDCQKERTFSHEELTSLKNSVDLLGIALMHANDNRQIVEKTLRMPKI